MHTHCTRALRPFTILEILGENTLAMVLELPHLVLPSKSADGETRCSAYTNG